MVSNEYIAGLFDGEGCVGFLRQFIKGKYEVNPRISLQVSITNLNYACLEAVRKKFGGTINDKGRCYCLRITGKEPMKNFLLSILPYTIVKTEQIEIGLEFIDTIRTENLGPVAMEDSIHAKRTELYKKMKVAKMVPNGSNSVEQTPEIARTPGNGNLQPSPAGGRFRDYNRSFLREDGIVRSVWEQAEAGRNDQPTEKSGVTACYGQNVG